jgi:hypothetical protein
MHQDFTDAKSRYKAFRKDVKAQLEFQLHDCDDRSDDVSNMSSKGYIDDTASETSYSDSASLAPYHWMMQSPRSIRAASPSPLQISSPLAQPNAFNSSPAEQLIYTHLRSETKARYLEFRAQAGELLDLKNVPMSIDTSVPLMPPTSPQSVDSPGNNSSSPFATITGSKHGLYRFKSLIPMVENKFRATSIHQQYPTSQDSLPFHTNTLRYAENLEEYPPTRTFLPPEENRLRQQQNQRNST